MDWDRLRIFKAVAEAGSFTNAMQKLNLSQSAISRNVGSLEESLGVKLFHRHARGLLLTENGESLLGTVKDVFHQLSMAEANLTEKSDHPSGTLTITATIAFGTTWLADQMNDFLKLYPDVDVNMVLSDTELDLGMRQADVAIRMGVPHQQDLMQRALVNFRLKIYASLNYLQEHGIPKTIEDLDQHHLILFSDNEPVPIQNVNWLETLGCASGKKRRARLRVNSLYGMYRALRSGLGIASLPDYMARDPASLDLKQILPEIQGPATMSYFVYPEELKNSPRIRAFRDFILKRVESLKINNQ